MTMSKAAAQEDMNAVHDGDGGPDTCFDPLLVEGLLRLLQPSSLKGKWSEERTRAQAERLTGELRRTLFDAGGEGGAMMSVAEAATLVDTIERLGVDGRFRQEITSSLGRLEAAADVAAGSDMVDDLHTVALRFRLLRQHGLRASADVFDKFRDGSGCFIASLCSDPRGLLSMYNAAHMAMPGETGLDDAIAFARCHLEAMKGELRLPMAKQVSRALDIPLPRLPRQLETMNYLAEYAMEDKHHCTLLELARLDFELVRSLHLEELKSLSLWWNDLYDSVKLSYARDRLVESYFWTCCLFHAEDCSRARIMFAKFFGFLSLMDDTYDVHATLEESHKLNEAIHKWDEDAVSIVPEYLRMFYMKLLSNFDELDDMLEPHEKYRMYYAKNMFKVSSEYYLREAKWSNDKYIPSFVEHLEVSIMSSGFPALTPVLLLGVLDGDSVATTEAFQWVAAVPCVANASGQVARFLNDIASYKTGKKNKKDVPSTVECYMAEHGVSGEAAVAAVAALVEHAWRTINQECVEVDRTLLPAARLVVNLTRTLEVIYLRGRDGYTFGHELVALVTNLFLDPIAV